MADEAVELAKNISNGNANAVCFSLLPMFHSSASQQSITPLRSAVGSSRTSSCCY